MQTRRKFSREFTLEARRLVAERGVPVAQADRDLVVGEGLLRRWMRQLADPPSCAFPGKGQQRAEQAEIVALKKEVVRLRAQRDVPKKWPRPTSRRSRYKVRLRREASPRLARELALRGP